MEMQASVGHMEEDATDRPAAPSAGCTPAIDAEPDCPGCRAFKAEFSRAYRGKHALTHQGGDPVVEVFPSEAAVARELCACWTANIGYVAVTTGQYSRAALVGVQQTCWWTTTSRSRADHMREGGMGNSGGWAGKGDRGAATGRGRVKGWGRAPGTASALQSGLWLDSSCRQRRRAQRGDGGREAG